jgi:uncharacterized protein (DUF3084 family)
VLQEKEKAEANERKAQGKLAELEEGAINDQQRLQTVKDEVAAQQARLKSVDGARMCVCVCM